MLRLLQMMALLCLCGLMTGCDGKKTLYSPPGRFDATNAPAVRIIEPVDGAKFYAPATIRLVALATPNGTDLGPEKELPFTHRDEWELVSSPEHMYTVEFLAGTNRLSRQSGSLVSARVKPVPGQAEPLLMVLVGYPAIEWIWHNVPAGNYTLTARATNEKGLATISSPIQITVLP